MRLLAVTLFALLAFASPAFATPVTNVTIGNAAPSSAAGARTVYAVGFTATSALGAGGQVDMTLPAGTGFGAFTGGTLRDVTAATTVGSCSNPSGQLARCTLFSTSVIAAGHTVGVTLNGVTNPAPSTTLHATITTTTDTTPVDSPAYTVVAGNPVTNVTVANAAPSAAAGARTRYVAEFKTSSGGGLSQAANSRIDVTFPAGTAFDGYTGATVRDVTTAVDVGSCGGDNALVIDCTLFSSAVINAGDTVRVTFNGIANPATTGAKTATVTTTSDLPPVTSAAFQVTAGNALSAFTVVNAAPSAATGARTLYVAKFTVSGSGGLAQAANSRLQVTFPSGTAFDGYTGASVRDVTTALNVGSCGSNAVLTIECTLFSSAVINPGDTVQITFNGIANAPTVGAKTMSARTTSDLPTVDSAPFDVDAAHAIGALTLANASPSAAAGARTQYVADFTVSSTGGLSQAANSRIRVTFPSGTGFGGYTGASVRDTTTAINVGSCGSDSNLAIECTLFSSAVINPGDAVRITFNGITNPATTGAKTIATTTTSDQSAVTSGPFDVVAAHPLNALTLVNASPSAGAGARTQYVAEFKVSSTGGLAQAANSRIDVTFPTGTAFGGYTGASVRDVTTAINVGSCGSDNALAIDCSLFSSAVVNAGDTLRITFNGITNPATTGAKTISATTTSDTQPVTSGPFGVVAGQPLTGVGVTAGSLAAGAATTYVVRLTTSATGGLAQAANSRIDVTFPAGTGFGSYTGSSVHDVTLGRNVGSCGSPSGLTIDCSLFSGAVIGAGDDVRITFNGISNPASAGPLTLTATTTSDTPAVTSSPYQQGDTAPPDTTIDSGPTGAATSPTRAFTFSAPGETGATFQCRVDAAAFAACTSPYTTPSLANGSHTFEVRTLDTAGNPDPTPASRTFTITATPPSAPVFVSPGQDVLLTTSTFALSGTAEAGTTVEVFEGAVSKGVASASDGTWTLTLSNVPDGEHSYTARATSPAGTSTASPNRTVRVQNAAPPAAPSVAGGPEGTQAAAFTFSSAESGTSFECSLDDGPFTACTSPKEYTGLPAGEHTFRVRAVAAGRGAGEPSSRSFFVAAPQPEATTTPVPSASPSPTPSATPTPAPTPTFKKDVVAAPASGTIQVCDKPGGRCHTLAPGEEIPLNQTIDARKGVVVLSSVAADGTVQTAKFYDGMFKVSQSATTTDLTLNEPLAPCSKQKASSSAAKPKTRKLWGDGKGKFRTKGTYSAATVRGTKWLVQDSCAGTLTQVKVGVVSVRDDVTHKTVTLRAGKRYTAKPR